MEVFLKDPVLVVIVPGLVAWTLMDLVQLIGAIQRLVRPRRYVTRFIGAAQKASAQKRTARPSHVVGAV